MANQNDSDNNGMASSVFALCLYVIQSIAHILCSFVNVGGGGGSYVSGWQQGPRGGLFRWRLNNKNVPYREYMNQRLPLPPHLHDDKK